MAKNEGLMIAGAIIVAALLFSNQAGAPPTDNGGNNFVGGIDLCKLVDGQASFTGQNKFLTGTALTTDWVRVIRQGSIMDLGLISMDRGTVALTPKAVYKLYYGENTTSTVRYTAVEEYTAPCQDATDDRVGILCTVDTAPTITIFDENGQVQSVSANAQAISANDKVDIEIKVKVAADKCYGNPDAPSKNAICFGYNSTVFNSVKANTGASAIPYSVSSDTAKATGYAQSCYELDLLSDTGSQILTVTLDAAGTDPTSASAINVSLEDIAFDLDQDSLDEIWGFEDETNNDLGAGIVRANIEVS